MNTLFRSFQSVFSSWPLGAFKGIQMKMRFIVIVTLFISLIALGAASVWAAGSAQALPFNQDWTNPALITAANDWAGVPGISGYDGKGLTSGIDINPQTLLAEASGAALNVSVNKTNPNTFASGGVAEFEIANPVVALQGSTAAKAPFILITINTIGQSNITVAYNLRDLDGSADNAVQQVALHYRIGNSVNFTNLPDGYVADATEPSLATLVTPVHVTLPANADNQPVVQLRIITTDATGSDEWVGIDDISISGTSIATITPSQTDTTMPTASASATETVAETSTLAVAPTLTATETIIPTAAESATPTALASPTGTMSETPTLAIPPILTTTETIIPTATESATPTASESPTGTMTKTPTRTVTSTLTATRTSLPTLTKTSTPTHHPPTPTATKTRTPTTTATYTSTPTATFTFTRTPTKTPAVITLQSTGAYDGWILESGENSNAGGSLNSTAAFFNLGDDAANKQYRGILHFDTSSLPDRAVITSVTLKLKAQRLVGTNPFATHGALLVDLRKPFFGATTRLATNDFQSIADKPAVAAFGAAPVGGWYNAVVGSAGYAFINLSGPTQFRLRFTRDDDNDHVADYMQFYSGSAAPAANRPQLVIKYSAP